MQVSAPLVMYVDTGQGGAQRLDNPAESVPGDALPRHNPHRLNTSNELLKNKSTPSMLTRLYRTGTGARLLQFAINYFRIFITNLVD